MQGNGISAATVITRVTDMTTWPTQSDLQKRFGVSRQAVTYWQRQGKITAHQDAEGTTRYNPEEIELFATARELAQDEGPGGGGASGSVNLGTVLGKPRQDLDSMMFRYMGFLQDRVVFLEGELNKSLEARERAADATEERKVVAATLASEQTMKESIVNNIGQAIERLTTRGKGAAGGMTFLDSLDVDQLKVMLCMDDVWSPQQQASILAKLNAKVAEAKKSEAKSDAAASSTPASSESEAETGSGGDAHQGEVVDKP